MHFSVYDDSDSVMLFSGIFLLCLIPKAKDLCKQSHEA